MRKGQSWTPADGLTSAVTFSWTVGVLDLMLSLFVTYLLFDLGASLEGPLLCSEGTLCPERPLTDSVAFLQWFLTDVWRTQFDNALPAQSIILVFIILLLCLPYAQYTHLFEIENRPIINHVQDCTEHCSTFIDLSVMFFELKHVSPSVVLRATAITIAKNASLRPHHRLRCQFLYACSMISSLWGKGLSLRITNSLELCIFPFGNILMVKWNHFSRMMGETTLWMTNLARFLSSRRIRMLVGTAWPESTGEDLLVSEWGTFLHILSIFVSVSAHKTFRWYIPFLFAHINSSNLITTVRIYSPLFKGKSFIVYPSLAWA